MEIFPGVVASDILDTTQPQGVAQQEWKFAGIAGGPKEKGKYCRAETYTRRFPARTVQIELPREANIATLFRSQPDRSRGRAFGGCRKLSWLYVEVAYPAHETRDRKGRKTSGQTSLAPLGGCRHAGASFVRSWR
jgi:hypothetical protein